MPSHVAPWLWPPWAWRVPLELEESSSTSLDMQRIGFWLVVVGLLIVIAFLSNPNDASFRSHLTELSFRRHLQDLHSDTEHSGGGGDRTPIPVTDDEEPAAPTPTAFRFANHVAISLRTPRYHLINAYVLTLVLTTAATASALQPPVPGKITGKKRDRLRSVGVASVHFGCLGSWWFIGNVPSLFEGIVSLWIPMKVEKSLAPGVLDCKAVVSDDSRANGKTKSLKDSLSSLDHAALTLPLHSTPSTPEKVAIPLPVPVTLPPPSPLGQPLNSEPPSSPLLTSLNSELSSAQAVVNDLHSQLSTLSDSLAASQAHLQANVDDLRTRRKEDDHERAELKSRTKTLEEQKRAAEGAKRESEKRLKAVESIRDAVLSRIKGMQGDMERMNERMVKTDKGQLTQLEDLARYQDDVKAAVVKKGLEMKSVEREVLRIEGLHEELGIEVKEAEEKLKAVLEYGEQARKLFNATASAADEHVHPSLQWGNQAAATYLPESFAQDYQQQQQQQQQHYSRQAYRPNDLAELTAASLGRLTAAADVSGFEDFGPAPAPGSPTGTMSSSFTATDLIPQGLFRSLEGEGTPVEVMSFDGESSGEETDDEFHIASPGFGASGEHRRHASHSTIQPQPAPTPPPAPAARRWFSPRSNGPLAFQQPTGSSDSLGTTSGPYEASPFAPSASEKKALRWGPISKYRWAGVNRSADELPAQSAGELASSSTPDLWGGGHGQVQGQAQGEGKQPFKLFSLRKPSAGVWN